MSVPSTLGALRFALHLVVATIVVSCVLAWQIGNVAPAGPPVSDARVYARLALGLHAFGVLGEYVDPQTAPRPAMEVAPLYPMFVAALLAVDPALRDTVRCALADGGDLCPREYGTLVVAQAAGMVVAVLLVGLTAWIWTASAWVAWAAMIAALAAGILAEFPSQFLTESVNVPLGAAFTCALAALIRRNTQRCAVLTGIALGLLVLARPPFWYLWLGFIVATVIAFAWPRWRSAGARLGTLLLVAALVFAPWLVRNQFVFEHASVSGGGYGARTLLQRVAYNRMTASEFAAAFVYWLPEFGDSLAHAALPPASYARLGWDSGSFYQAGRVDMRSRIAALGEANATGAILRSEVFGQPLRHARATVALAWRGMFVGKLWGLIGWLCLVAALLRAWRARDATLLLLCLPALALWWLHAAVSVSIPRYNFLLWPLLAMAMAMQIERGVERWRARRDV